MSETDDPPSDAGGPGADGATDRVRSAGTAPERFASIARVLAWALAAYAAAAVGLVVLSLRRGRLFDALIIVVVLLFTTPLILGYRRQALERHRRMVAGRSAPADERSDHGSEDRSSGTG